MNRRELLQMIAAATGTAMIGSTAALTGCATTGRKEPPERHFSEADVRLLDEVAETILPRTDTPGAKDAGVGAFMSVYVADCYTESQQRIFHSGLAQLRATAERDYGRDFMALSAEQRTEMVRRLDREAKAVAGGEGEPHYFTMIKQLTLFGFFTSEVGGTEVLRYVAVPGRYDGCTPYEPGEPAWATS